MGEHALRSMLGSLDRNILAGKIRDREGRRRRRLSIGARNGLLMPRNQKLTAVVTGRCVQSATPELGILIIVFDDQSTMTVKTAGIATTISAGAKMKAVLENGDQCTLQFEDGSSVTVKLADPGASVAVRDRSNAVEYLG